MLGTGNPRPKFNLDELGRCNWRRRELGRGGHSALLILANRKTRYGWECPRLVFSPGLTRVRENSSSTPSRLDHFPLTPAAYQLAAKVKDVRIPNAGITRMLAFTVEERPSSVCVRIRFRAIR